jgi:hypothetical protein
MKNIENNIDKYDKELREYTKESIFHANYNEVKWNYLHERLKAEKLRVENEEFKHKNEVLRKRLFMCKRDNRNKTRNLINVINFLTCDPQDALKIRRISHITWDVDKLLGRLIVNTLSLYKKRTNSVPGAIAKRYKKDSAKKKAWDNILDSMAEAFIILECKESFAYSIQEGKKVKEGLRNFVKYFQCLWD